MNFALQNSQGQQLGFLLMVADETQIQTGACLIHLMAENEILAQSPAGQLLSTLQSLHELNWTFDGQKTIITDQNNQLTGSIKEQILTIEGTQFVLVDMVGNI